jgi:hypothetical protein
LRTRLQPGAGKTKPRGGVKKNDESDVHLPQPQKKVATCFIYLFFFDFFLIAFLGVS